MKMNLVSTRSRRWMPLVGPSLIAILISGAIGCATLLPQSQREYVPPETLEVLEGWIVSMDEELRSVTIKDDEFFRTWTVSILEETRIRTPEGNYLAIADLQIGDRIEVRGTSRVKNHVTALDIELLEDLDS